VGGILAVGAITWRALRRRLDGKAAETAAEQREASIPYAPAIALGVWLALVPKG
jgi:Flp pilus assembly protein protease CpaA